MNPQIEKLYQVSQKSSRLIIGLMSGTSMDGLDVALCRFHNAGKKTSVELLEFETVPFDKSVKSEIRKVFAKQSIDFPLLCMLNPWIGNMHGEMVNNCLRKWSINASKIDAIASHGQTVMHQPKRLHGLEKYPNSTLQIGDGDHMATKTGILTLSDFRQKHCATGGEGAPLALYGDYLLFSSNKENRVLINIGGIANFTYLPANGDFEKVFATDSGPGNTIIDAYVQQHFNLPFDENAAIAKKGNLNETLLKRLKEHKYFKEQVPKTTGPELFNLAYIDSLITHISHEDVLKTLCHFTADTLCDCIIQNVDLREQTSLYLSGGGMHNPLLVELIKQRLPNVVIDKMDVLGISGDAKEAVLFAALANETLSGETGFQKPNNGLGSFSMGKISLPN
ncbi:anhydro-N-acetylmuramic acid kinase [Arcticibacterium luteifluviistationis]|uniref:Anhydro-N-acetylmuramic acid kinase n=1 Tax=Arcticibacterium luteifluviistationis TaxID=1784714 RepID=A0A2Z4GG33_9BACT|nr:anhydro-N-acetylmuramic acid kinase [Arcticibacterium luteifluviistationis]AWV99743.1 anhydro-N-acetylmuramic acid kinase [Arcticibacterium luteifluviistationis]